VLSGDRGTSRGQADTPHAANVRLDQERDQQLLPMYAGSDIPNDRNPCAARDLMARPKGLEPPTF
jgi:hypothetical protein